jgi:hypothetical protein
MTLLATGTAVIAKRNSARCVYETATGFVGGVDILGLFRAYYF